MADTIDVDTFAEGLSDRVLHCRELGHVWRPNTVAWDPKARAYDRSLRCSSCRTVRVQVLDSRGHVISNRYIYPDGYLASNVEHVGASRDVFRLVALRRYMNTSEVA